MATAYDDLLDRYARITYVGDAAGLLHWDQQVMMPDGGNPARSKQTAALSAIRHDLLTDDEVGDLLDDAESADLDDDQQAVVREIRYEHERNAKVPEDLVEEIAETSAAAQQTWQDAKADADFEAFAPTLETIRELHVERAEHIDPDRSPYEVMHEDSERDVPLAKVEEIFDQLRSELVPLIEDIRENGDDLPSPFHDHAPYDEDDQMALSEAAVDLLGYDRDRGRLDTSPHPFTSGTQFDARITTRFQPDDPIDALTATVHEFGHATYMLGLPDDHYGSPLGQSRSSGVHESQSRFWENHVGRTRPFWELFLPTMKEQFPELKGVSVEDAYRAVNRIYPDNTIRVEADELTYHFHVILRHEIGRQFVEGDLDVEEIPGVWNDKMGEYLGVRPDDAAEGALQDIHWTGGFAAFQGYTIGSVLAAQLDAALRREVDDVDGKIREGNFGPLREWMTENVHRHGKRYPADELIEVATGEPLTADYFVDYAREKFERLYGL
ncbi:MAG: carboxypeptidase M32 [Halobacteriales archaeon]